MYKSFFYVEYIFSGLLVRGNVAHFCKFGFILFLDHVIFEILDSRTAIQLYLFPSLVPPKGRTKLPNKTHWKPSVVECRESLILHVKIPGDIAEAKKKELILCMVRDLLYSHTYCLLEIVLII